MLKRATALFFLILANIILLAHDLVPHHHHQQSVCVESQHCEDDGKHHDDIPAEGDHHHDEQDNSSSCVLKQAAILPSGQIRQTCGCDSDHFHAHDAANTSSFAHFEVLIPYKVPESAFPEILFPYQFHFTSSSGLRAPPVI